MPVYAGMFVIGAGAYIFGAGTAFWAESRLDSGLRVLTTLAAAGAGAYVTYKLVG